MTQDQEPVTFTARALADGMELLRAGRADRVAMLRKDIADRKTRRSPDDADRLARAVPLLERAALVFKALAEFRDELPPWIVELIENGKAP